MKGSIWLFVAVMAMGIYAFASPAPAVVVRACSVENPPPSCEKMWAVVAHVVLPRQPIPAGAPPPHCGSRFDRVNWGKIVADAFKAESDPDELQNLALDVSDAFQRKAIPLVTRHILGDARTYIESGFSAHMPKAWSMNRPLEPDDQAWCAPVIATVPANATVDSFRLRAWDENLGEMGCTRGKDCSIGDSRFLKPAMETTTSEIAVYTAIFQNWSTRWPREGRMTIFFEMPAGIVPQQHL